MTVFELTFFSSILAGGIFVLTLACGLAVQIALFSVGLVALAFTPSFFFPSINTNSMVLTYVLSWFVFCLADVGFRKIFLKGY